MCILITSASFLNGVIRVSILRLPWVFRFLAQQVRGHRSSHCSVLRSFHKLHSSVTTFIPLWGPRLLIGSYSHTLKFTLCAVRVCAVLTRARCPYPPPQSKQSSFTTLQSVLCSPVNTRHTQPLPATHLVFISVALPSQNVF